jgi:SAM-dependent methyltransferase
MLSFLRRRRNVEPTASVAGSIANASSEPRVKPAPVAPVGSCIESAAAEVIASDAASVDANLIDVKQLIAETSVEELCETAEEYFRRVSDVTYYLSKPFYSASEMVETFIPFAQLVQNLKLVAGLRVLDFGAGTCWSSRWLTQMGCEVIALDASPTALKIGRDLYALQPVAGDQPEPQFLVFDGRRIDLPDESVDRIICFDAFHHVPNPAHVLAEMGRVLKGGGIAAFSEPGPGHSKSPRAQQEMRLYRVVENDIDVHEIWETAREVGFTDIKFAIFNVDPFLLSLADFEDYLAGGETMRRYAEAARQCTSHRRAFFLYKGALPAPDSRQGAGLMAQLSVELSAHRIAEGQTIKGRATVTNSSGNIWLPTTQRIGAVLLGTHLLDAKGVLLELDYARHRLTPGVGRPVHPGETLEVELAIAPPPKGRYVLNFDLVSEGICWFENNGSQTVKLEIEII